MKPIFADTSYFLAFLGEKDQHHQRAVAWTRALCAPVVTTEYVVIEVGNSLTKVGDRAVFVDFYRALRQGTKLEVIAASTELQDRGAKRRPRLRGSRFPRVAPVRASCRMKFLVHNSICPALGVIVEQLHSHLAILSAPGRRRRDWR